LREFLSKLSRPGKGSHGEEKAVLGECPDEEI
jgi:hypothetical protein